MRLPADVLGAGKQGSKPLAAHLRRHERTLEEEKNSVAQRAARTAAASSSDRGREAADGQGPRPPRQRSAAEGEGEGTARCSAAANSGNLPAAATPRTVDGEDRPQRLARVASVSERHRRQHRRAAQRARHDPTALHGPRAVGSGRRARRARFCGS